MSLPEDQIEEAELMQPLLWLVWLRWLLQKVCLHMPANLAHHSQCWTGSSWPWPLLKEHAHLDPPTPYLAYQIPPFSTPPIPLCSFPLSLVLVQGSDHPKSLILIIFSLHLILIFIASASPFLPRYPIHALYPIHPCRVRSGKKSCSQATMATIANHDRETTQPTCQNCSTSTTPLWRRDEMGSVLCNACGLFLKLHGRPRPISLKTDVIKSRNRVKTMRPDVAMKKKVRVFACDPYVIHPPAPDD